MAVVASSRVFLQSQLVFVLASINRGLSPVSSQFPTHMPLAGGEFQASCRLG